MALGIPMALLLSSLAGGGMSMLGNMLGNKEGQQTGYDVVNMPTYDWAEGTQRDTNSYLMDMLQQMKKGKTPAWMDYLNPVQQGMQKDLSDRYYGTAGRPGTLRDVMGSASMMGVGPRAAMSKATQSSADYLSEASKIDQYISGLKYNTMSNQSTQVPQMLAGMARGPETQIVNYGGGVGAGNQSNMGSMIGDVAQSIPWEQMFKGTGTGTTGTTNPYSDILSQLGQYQSIGGSQGGTYNPGTFSGGYSLTGATNNPYGMGYGF